MKTSGENEAIYVNYRASRVQCQVCLSIAEAQPIITESNSEFLGGNTGTARFSLYFSPYLVAGQGGKYTKHIYIGSQRIVSKLGDLVSYGADPRRIPYAGNEADGVTVDYKAKYSQQLQSIKDNYKAFDQPYNGKDNDDYVNGQVCLKDIVGCTRESLNKLTFFSFTRQFCCNDGTPEAAQARARTRAANGNFKPNDDYEKMQFYYHPDHLGSSSYITNLDGEVSQHIEYVPFGEVFIEERNNTWNTPYLFNAKDLDEETGMYYYDGARYYAPRLNLWMSTDPLQEKYHNISSYCYTFNNTIKFIDPNGQDGWDKVKGFGAALLDNATGGLINLRSYAGRHVSNPTDFNRGLAAGDAASVGIGTWEGGTGAGMIASRTTITTVGLAAEGPSLGISTVVVVIGGGGRQQGLC